MTDTTRESVERTLDTMTFEVVNSEMDRTLAGCIGKQMRALLTRAEAAEEALEISDGANMTAAAQYMGMKAERDAAMAEALSLAKSLHATHYSDVHQWEPLDYPAGVISQIDNMVAGIIERAKAERDALQAKLALAVEALTPSGETKAAYIAEVETSCPDGRSHTISWTATKDVMKMIRARAQLTADTPPDPRIEGWNAAIEAAAEIYEEQFNRLSILIRAIPCPYHPKEKDDE